MTTFAPGRSDDPRPFVGAGWCSVVLPAIPTDPFAPLASFAALLRAEVAELEVELGCRVRWDSPHAGAGASARCLIGPGSDNPAIAAAGLPAATGPVVIVDRVSSLVVIDGTDLAEVGTAFQLLRTAIRSGRRETRPQVLADPSAVFDLLAEEVWHTWPSFDLRGIDWPTLVAAHRDDVLSAGASLESLQRWFAELQDAHTWVKSPSTTARLPYQAWIDPDRAILTHIPFWSAGWAAGARPGDDLLDCDAMAWWERTSATPHTRPLVTGYRWLAGAAGETRTLRVRNRAGAVVAWDETFQPLPWPEMVSWRVLSEGTGYLRIRGWLHTRAWTAHLNAAFEALWACPRLLVDLRGNSGGSLVAAQRFRDRFLPGETELGSVRFSIGNGQLDPPSTLVASPPEWGRWRKPVRFLIDRQTYSASEDAILGLGGLPHVQIVGEPSGGGSGRPRTISLADGVFATISTALTYDRTGHCVESNGVPVALALPLAEYFRDPHRLTATEILAMADQDWF